MAGSRDMRCLVPLHPSQETRSIKFALDLYNMDDFEGHDIKWTKPAEKGKHHRISPTTES